MDDVVVLVVGRENGGNEIDKLIGSASSIFVIGVPVSDMLTTLSEKISSS